MSTSPGQRVLAMMSRIDFALFNGMIFSTHTAKLMKIRNYLADMYNTGRSHTALTSLRYRTAQEWMGEV